MNARVLGECAQHVAAGLVERDACRGLAIGDAYGPGLELHNRRSAPLQPADAQRLIDRRFSGLVGRAPDARHSRAAVRSRLRISIVYDRQRERERLPDLRALRRRRIDDLGRRVRWLVEVDRRAAAAIG
jgi:hypothetical protein